MSHLAEVYAKDLGVKIDNPIFKPHFFPIVDKDFITINTSSEVQANQYDYWEEVITIVKNINKDLKFFQIGESKDIKIRNVDKFIQTSSIKQSAYIVQNSLVHVGTSEPLLHIASCLNKPIVAIFGNTYANTSKPIWGDSTKQIIIESHRDGNKPSFSGQEIQKNINKIRPEEIANAILKLLGLKQSNIETLFIGRIYKTECLDVVPDNPYDIVHHNMVIRMDLHHNEKNIIPLLNKNQCIIITNKSIDANILRHKNIKQINYIANTFDESFVDTMKNLGKDFVLLCGSKHTLNEERAKFFDERVPCFDKQEVIENNKKKFTYNQSKFSSFKKVLKNGKIFNSHFESNGSENLDDFYLDLDYMFIYDVNHE